MSHGVDGRPPPVGSIDGELAASVAETMHVLSTPSRVRILGRLRSGPCSVGELGADLQMGQSTVSHQLAILRHLGLVVGRREGRRRIYALHDPHLATLLEQAVHHVEHVRLGQPDPVALEAAS